KARPLRGLQDGSDAGSSFEIRISFGLRVWSFVIPAPTTSKFLDAAPLAPPFHSTPPVFPANVLAYLFALAKKGAHYPAMKFTISKDDFLGALQQVQHVVSTRTTLPILSNVLLRASD